MIDSLIQILIQKGLKTDVLEKSVDAFIISFDVWAKPGAKNSKEFISNDGVFIIQTRAKPVDGEANDAIVEAISKSFGISKSQIELVRGDKSRLKKIKVKLVITANKNQTFFQKKLNEIEVQVASN